ncbi:hypothetical protein VNO78_08522 [Psophocarpus tetragonolobus]|uniref:Uncharacterized protein n=1 Tax=Psophocarpus tetragonolobus TaxID=3891 RepID=A0AAN9T5W0_PSOTE
MRRECKSIACQLYAKRSAISISGEYAQRQNGYSLDPSALGASGDRMTLEDVAVGAPGKASSIFGKLRDMLKHRQRMVLSDSEEETVLTEGCTDECRSVSNPRGPKFLGLPQWLRIVHASPREDGVPLP